MKKIYFIISLIVIFFLIVWGMSIKTAAGEEDEDNSRSNSEFDRYAEYGSFPSWGFSPLSPGYNPWYGPASYNPYNSFANMGALWSPFSGYSSNPYGNFSSSEQWGSYYPTQTSTSGYWTPFAPPWATGIHAIDIMYAPIYGRNNPYETGGFTYHPPWPDYIPNEFPLISPASNPDYESHNIYEDYM